MKKIDAQTPIRLAFLGCGFATRMHSKTIASVDSSVQCYYASRSEDKAREYNEKQGGSGYFGSYDTAIAAGDINVVLIATPPVSHLELTLKALKAGKHVIVEKPPYLYSSDFDTVQEAADTSGCQVMVAENYFYKPSLGKLREVIASGDIGDVLFIIVNALKFQKTGNWRDDLKVSGGGALFEGGIHWINFMSNLGLSVNSVKGFQPSPVTTYEKSMMVGFEYKEGAIGGLFYSWEVPSLFKGLRISRIFGRDGSVTFESNGIFICVRGKRTRLIFPGLKDISGYRAMFSDFFRALRHGNSPRFTFEMAKRDIMFIEDVYKSVQKENR